MFGLLISIVQRMEQGNTGLTPDEVRRLKAATPLDMADVVVRLSRLDCVEVVDDAQDDLEVMMERVANSQFMNEKVYYVAKVLSQRHPILNTESWNDFTVVLGK